MRKLIFLLLLLSFIFINCSTGGVVGEYSWDAGPGLEAKVIINEDGTWKREVYENGVLQEDNLGWYSGKYSILKKEIKKADGNYTAEIISFDGNGQYGYVFSNGCIRSLTDDILLQTNISQAQIPFKVDSSTEYCKD